jgi:hypothetical protein
MGTICVATLKYSSEWLEFARVLNAMEMLRLQKCHNKNVVRIIRHVK